MDFREDLPKPSEDAMDASRPFILHLPSEILVRIFDGLRSRPQIHPDECRSISRLEGHYRVADEHVTPDGQMVDKMLVGFCRS